MIDQEKIRTWVEGYLAHVGEVGAEYHVKSEEGYKFIAVDHFQKTFNIDAPNLVEMLDSAILDTNLVAGVQFLPKKMLLHLAREYEPQVREILRLLFNDAQPVYDRLDSVHARFEGLMEERNQRLDRHDKSYVGLRFLSLLLGFHGPEKYNAIKPSNWRRYCRYVDEEFVIPQGATPGEQYRIYEPYIEALRSYIRGVPEITELKKSLVAGLSFSDNEYRWMAQNVIYIGWRQFAAPIVEKHIKEAVIIGEDESEEYETGDDFKSEAALEIHIAKHWKSIPYFSGFELQKGSAPHGGQFPAEGKSIDLLAYSPGRKLWLVIELKKRGNPDSYKSVGQVQTYMGFIANKLAKEGDSVRGLIITGDYDKDIANATSVTANVGWLVYSVRTQYTDFQLRDPQGEPQGLDDLFSG